MKRIFFSGSIMFLAISTIQYVFCLSGYAAPHYEPHVVIKSDHVNKRIIYKSHIRGGVKNIRLGTFRPSLSPEIILLNQKGTHFLSTENYTPVDIHLYHANNINSASTQDFGIRPDIIDINGDGDYVIMKGGGGFGETGLLDKKGKKLWIFQPTENLPPRKMIHGDLNKDNKLEFYANDFGALYRLDEKGSVIWKIDKNTPDLNLRYFNDIGIFTENGSEQPFLLAVTNRDFVVINFDGKIVKRFKSDYKIQNFEIVRWNKEQFILSGYFRKKVIMLDMKGNKIHEFKLKDFPLYHAPNAVAVKFRPGEKEYLVLLAHSRSRFRLTQLNIISPEGQIIYQEIINGTKGLAPLFRKEKNSEVLIIGDGFKQVLEYSLQ